MLRTSLVALVALFISIFSVSAEEMDADAIYDMAYYTPDYEGPIAPLNWDPDNSPIHPGLAWKIMSSLPHEYAVVSQSDDLRFAGQHMVLIEGCGGYLQCGVILDLATGRPVTQLPPAGPGGFEFDPNCDLLGVRPPDRISPEKVTDIIFYRLTPNGLVLLDEKYPECMAYGSHVAENFPVLPAVGPVPQFRLDRSFTGSISN